MTGRTIYPDDLAAACAKKAGQKYQPSNGTEGWCFIEAWCADCAREAAFRADPALGEGCAILATTMALRVDDEDYPAEWQFGPDGQPRCTAFTVEGMPDRCRHTSDLFGEPS